MSTEKLTPAQIESIETIDVVTDDLIEGLAANRRSTPGQLNPRVFIIENATKHSMATLVDPRDIEDRNDVLWIAPKDFTRQDGKVQETITRTYILDLDEETEATLNARVQLA